MTPYPLPPARLVPTIEFLSRNVPPRLAMFPPRPAPTLPAEPGNAPLPAAPLVPPIALPLPAVISALPPLPPLPAVTAFPEKVQLMIVLVPAFQIPAPRQAAPSVPGYPSPLLRVPAAALLPAAPALSENVQFIDV